MANKGRGITIPLTVQDRRSARVERYDSYMLLGIEVKGVRCILAA